MVFEPVAEGEPIREEEAVVGVEVDFSARMLLVRVKRKRPHEKHVGARLASAVPGVTDYVEVTWAPKKRQWNWVLYTVSVDASSGAPKPVGKKQAWYKDEGEAFVAAVRLGFNEPVAILFNDKLGNLQERPMPPQVQRTQRPHLAY